MAQKVPFGCGWSRWQATYTYTSTNTINPTTTLHAPGGSEILDPTTTGGQRFRTANAGSTTTITESGLASPGWVTNQWANYWVYAIAGTGAGQYSLIASNTSGTGGILTFAAVGTAFDNTTVYTIRKSRPFGPPVVLIPSTGVTFSTATGTFASTTLADSAVAWAYNQWQGYEVRIIAGTNIGQTARITKNDAMTLTFAPAMSAATDATTVYQICPPTGPRIVLTEFEATAGAATSTAAGLWSIDSFDLGGANALVMPLTKFSLYLSTGAQNIMATNTEMFRIGFPNSGLRITPSGWTGTNIAMAITVGGYFIDPNDPVFSF